MRDEQEWRDDECQDDFDYSPDEGPEYNDQLDPDQQSQEWWDSL